MAAAPSVTIDFERQFSLPVGVPPELSAADLQTYCADLGVAPGWLEYTYKDTDSAPTNAALTDTDPGLPSDRRIALLKEAGASNKAIVVPCSFDIAALAAGAVVRGIPITVASIAAIGQQVWTPAAAQGGETLPVANAARFRWDTDAITASVLPQPFHPDECLALVMEPAAPTKDIGADLDGVFDDPAATHLLHTTSSGRDGELDQLLLRAPALALARFERYRHIEATLAGNAITALSVRAQSTAGAMILHVLPDAMVPPADTLEPLLKDHRIVLEHLAVDDVTECLAPVIWMQLLRFDVLIKIAKFKDEVRRQCAWVFRTWLAHITLGLGATGDGGLPSAVTDPFKQTAATHLPTIDHIKAAISAVMGNANAKTGLRNFIEQSYAPILAGKHWVELGTNFPVAPADRQAAQMWAHNTLESVMMDSHVSLVVYAGCPLGRPSKLYPAAPPVEAATILTSGTSTFDLEALVLASRADEVFADVNAPAAPAARTGTVALGAYAAKAQGYLAAVRVVEATRTRSFTTRDCLRTSVTGWHHNIRILSTMDFTSFAAAGHPLGQALWWDQFAAAETARQSLDALDNAAAGGKPLSQQNVEFWVAAAGFGTGGNWPVLEPGGAPGTLAAGPTRPYMPGDTSAGIRGFDDLDVESALIASEFLRWGADTAKKVSLPVILALLDREGFRLNSLWKRAGPFGGVVKDNSNGINEAGLSAASKTKPGFRDGFARIVWALETFGLDVLDARLLPNGGAVAAVNDWKQFARVRFAEHLQRLLDAGVVVELDPARMKEYTVARTVGKTKADGTLQAQLLSSDLQWIGIVAQQGEFQRRHALVRQGPGAGKLDAFWMPDANGTQLKPVAEYAADPPDPGADAESASRYDYLAYYSFLYLAFNGSPAVFNSWVTAADAHRNAIPAPTYFLYKITDVEAAGDIRMLWHRGHVMRFITALDAYLRLDGPDTAAIVRPNPPWDK